MSPSNGAYLCICDGGWHGERYDVQKSNKEMKIGANTSKIVNSTQNEQ